MTRHVVSRLGQRGDGIVDAPDGVRHVPKVLAGETVELAGSRLLRVVTPSSDRVEPFCQHYATCGGCKFQHWRAEAYRAWKLELVRQALAGQGLPAEVMELVDAHGDGRRRVSFHVRKIDGEWRAGFMEQKSHDLAPLDHCPVLVPALQDSPELAAAFGPLLGECDVALTAAANGLDVSIKAERKATDKRSPALSALFNARNLLRLSVNGEVFAMAAPPGRAGGQDHGAIARAILPAGNGQGEEELAGLSLRPGQRRPARPSISFRVSAHSHCGWRNT
jgi:23S rRNA (uracil1939-C5)-methyltransferase